MKKHDEGKIVKRGFSYLQIFILYVFGVYVGVQMLFLWLSYIFWCSFGPVMPAEQNVLRVPRCLLRWLSIRVKHYIYPMKGITI